jgi:parallel beta-helix repeat protein
MKAIKFLISILALFLFSNSAIGVTYYFSTINGNDSRTAAQAQNASTPWQSINKLNSIMNTLVAGDKVLFNRGETFTGQITITVSGSSGSPITFGAYGTGVKPVIDGASPVTNWTSLGGNIWQASFPAGGSTVTGVYMSGKSLPLGRWPNANAANKGYVTINAISGNTMSSNSLSGAPTSNWTGGELGYRQSNWTINRTAITAQSGNTLTVNSFNGAVGFGFFVQNHSSTLDQNGEWYYDAANKKIRIYYTSDPNTTNIKATAFSSCISVSNRNYITIDNLTLQGSTNENFIFSYCTYLVFQNSKSINAGTNAITCTSGSTNHVTIQYDTILNTNNNAINLWTVSDLLVQNNYIKNTGILIGRGVSGDGNYQGIQSNGFGPTNNVIIQNNVMDSVGYAGISAYGCDNVLIKNNFVNHFCITKDDGAGIYFYTGNNNTVYTGRKIISNIVLNAVGAPEGTNNPSYIPAMGIYMDDNVANVELIGNSVANCRSGGIFLHNAHEIIVNKNTLYNSNAQLLMAHAQFTGFQNNKSTDNIFFARQASQEVFHIDDNSFNNVGTMDSNYYCRPLDDNLALYYYYGNSTVKYSLQSWQTALNKDMHTKKTPAGVIADSVRFEYNATFTAKTISFPPGAIYIDVKGKTYSGSTTLQPFTSLILMRSTQSSCTVASSIVLTAGSNPGCPGSLLTFTASATNGGTTPAYQWKVNGTNVGTNSATFTTSTLTNGQVVSCVITSNASCASPTTASSNSITVNIGTAQSLPGIVQGENFCSMSGIQNETCTDVGGGQNAAYINQNDWMDYAVNVTAAGNYTINYRLASGMTGAQFQLLKGSTVLNTINVPATGGFQNWQTVTTTINLSAGVQTLRILSTQVAEWNINWFEVKSIATGTLESIVQDLFTLYPNPATDEVNLNFQSKGAEHLTFTVSDMLGKVRLIEENTSQNGDNYLKLNIENLENGIYFIKVVSENMEQVRKIYVIK